MTQPLYPAATYRPVRNHGGPMRSQHGLILHVAEANGSVHDWFDNPASQASSTFWVAKNGGVEQYIEATVEAWAQGAGNPDYCSVETAGFATEPLTEAQIEALAHLYVWGHNHHGWRVQQANKPGQAGFGWHGMGGTAWGGHVGCPGDLRKAQRPAILKRVRVILDRQGSKG